jgi:hypothetical protein
MPPRLNQQNVKYETYKTIAFGGTHPKKMPSYLPL